jgi:uncharacterized protein (DUF58 family)
VAERASNSSIEAPDRIERLGNFTSRFKFSRLHQSEALPILINRKRIYVLPSSFGLFVSLVFVALLLGGLNYNNNPALLWTFLLLAIAHNSLVQAHLSLSGLQLKRIHAQPVHAGQLLNIECELEAGTARDRKDLEVLIDQHMQRISISDTSLHSVTVSVPSKTRGWYDIPRMRISTTAPLGLVRAWSWLKPNIAVLVYPALEVAAPPLPLGQGASGSQRTQRQGEQPHHLREYHTGDSFRQIAWKSSARSGQLMVREYEMTQPQLLQLDWQSLAHLPYEHRIQRLARWAVDADKRGLHYSMRLPQQQIGPDHGEAHRHRCLRALALMPHE